MSEFLGKLSTYNLFNYLFTGVLFVAITSYLTPFSFVQENLILAPFVYYFIGLVLSRIGSLIIEPTSKNDPQIEILSEDNNMYRTLCALFIAVILLKIYAIAELTYPVLHNIATPALIVGMLLMFLFAYRKQTNYITRRIAKNI
jgi:hypothetical protein